MKELTEAEKILIEKYKIHVSAGWKRLVVSVLKKIEKHNKKHPDKKIECIYCKEKWGRCRFEIYDNSTRYIYKLTIKAERKSGHICEFCGSKGKETELDMWIKTLCAKCAEERKRKILDGTLYS